MAQILEVDACHVYLTKDFACGLDDTNKDLIFAGSSLEIDDSIYSKNIGYNLDEVHPVVEAYKSVKTVQEKNIKGFKELKEEGYVREMLL